jgi:hypothetical protein
MAVESAFPIPFFHLKKIIPIYNFIIRLRNVSIMGCNILMNFVEILKLLCYKTYLQTLKSFLYV